MLTYIPTLASKYLHVTPFDNSSSRITRKCRLHIHTLSRGVCRRAYILVTRATHTIKCQTSGRESRGNNAKPTHTNSPLGHCNPSWNAFLILSPQLFRSGRTSTCKLALGTRGILSSWPHSEASIDTHTHTHTHKHTHIVYNMRAAPLPHQLYFYAPSPPHPPIPLPSLRM
jgi:hypothetical protein